MSDDNKSTSDDSNIEYLYRGYPCKLFSPSYGGRYVFVSHDEKNGDAVVEAHPDDKDARNEFIPEAVEYEGERLIRFRNAWNDLYLFISRDEMNGDHIVEAHSSPDDLRGWFRPTVSAAFTNHVLFQDVCYDEYLFVSRDTWGGDNVLEGHANEADRRDEFIVMLGEVERYEMTDLVWDIDASQIVSKPPEAMREFPVITRGQGESGVAKLTKHTETSHTFGGASGMELSISTSVTCGLPFLAEGTVEIGMTASLEFNWSETTTQAVEWGVEANYEVPAWSIQIISLMLTETTMDVPYRAHVAAIMKSGRRVEFDVDGVWRQISWGRATTSYGDITPNPDRPAEAAR